MYTACPGGIRTTLAVLSLLLFLPYLALSDTPCEVAAKFRESEENLRRAEKRLDDLARTKPPQEEEQDLRALFATLQQSHAAALTEHGRAGNDVIDTQSRTEDLRRRMSSVTARQIADAERILNGADKAARFKIVTEQADQRALEQSMRQRLPTLNTEDTEEARDWVEKAPGKDFQVTSPEIKNLKEKISESEKYAQAWVVGPQAANAAREYERQLEQAIRDEIQRCRDGLLDELDDLAKRRAAVRADEDRLYGGPENADLVRKLPANRALQAKGEAELAELQRKMEAQQKGYEDSHQRCLSLEARIADAAESLKPFDEWQRKQAEALDWKERAVKELKYRTEKLDDARLETDRARLAALEIIAAAQKEFNEGLSKLERRDSRADALLQEWDVLAARRDALQREIQVLVQRGAWSPKQRQRIRETWEPLRQRREQIERKEVQDFRAGLIRRKEQLREAWRTAHAKARALLVPSDCDAFPQAQAALKMIDENIRRIETLKALAAAESYGLKPIPDLDLPQTTAPDPEGEKPWKMSRVVVRYYHGGNILDDPKATMTPRSGTVTNGPGGTPFSIAASRGHYDVNATLKVTEIPQTVASDREPFKVTVEAKGNWNVKIKEPTPEWHSHINVQISRTNPQQVNKEVSWQKKLPPGPFSLEVSSSATQAFTGAWREGDVEYRSVSVNMGVSTHDGAAIHVRFDYTR